VVRCCVANQHGWDPRGASPPPYGAGGGGYPAVPVESGAHRVVGQAYAPSSSPQVPQAILDAFTAQYSDIYGQRGVEIFVSLIRDRRVAQFVRDPELLAALAQAPMQFGVRADRLGRWQAYFPHDHTVLELGRGETAIFDLGAGGTSGILWFLPDQPASLILWLYLYVNGVWLPFDPSAAHPHQVETNGALRCWVPN